MAEAREVRPVGAFPAVTFSPARGLFVV